MNTSNKQCNENEEDSDFTGLIEEYLCLDEFTIVARAPANKTSIMKTKLFPYL